ncbi:hypothetical protein N9R79_07630 [Vibrio sp.]|nr:hypothetical protein [Vibrio sp.]
MTRIIAIVALIALAVVLVKYRTNEKVHKKVVVSLGIVAVIFVVSMMLFELFR